MPTPHYHSCKISKDGFLLIQKGIHNNYIEQVCPLHGTREHDQKFCGDWCPLLEEDNNQLTINCGYVSNIIFKIIIDER